MNGTITAINTPSYKIKAGKCNICMVRKISLTHKVKFDDGKVIKICSGCANS